MFTRDARGSGGDGERDVRRRQLQRVDRSERHRRRRRAEHHHGLRESRQLRDEEADRDEPPTRVPQLMAQMLEVEAADRGRERQERENDQRDLEQRSERDAPHLLQLGCLDARSPRGASVEVVEIEPDPTCLGALSRRQGGRLREWQRGGQPIRTECVDREIEGRVGPERERGGDQHLRLVGPHPFRRGTDRGAAKVDQAHYFVVGDDEIAIVERTVREARVVQYPQHVPHALGDGTGPPIGDGHQLPADRTEHEDDIVVGRGAGGDDPRSQDPGLVREQREQGFVLDLLQPAQGERRAGLAVPNHATQGGDELRVVRIASVDLDHERLAVVVECIHQKEAGGLPVGGADGSRRDSERVERGGDVGQTRSAPARTEGEVDGTGAHDGDEQAGQRSGRSRRIEQDRRNRGDADDPSPEAPRRFGEMRRCGHHDPAGNREPEARK